MTDRASATTGALTVGLGVLVVLAMIGGVLSYKQVPEGHEGVTTEWGAVSGETLSSGAHWKIPIMQGVQDVEIRPRTYTMADTEGEGDKAAKKDAVVVQSVNGTSPIRIDITIRYRIQQKNADDFVREWNNEGQMEHRLIRPTVRSTLRDEAYQQNPVILRVEYIEALKGGSVFVVPEGSETPIIMDSSSANATVTDGGSGGDTDKPRGPGE